MIELLVDFFGDPGVLRILMFCLVGNALCCVLCPLWRKKPGRDA